MILCVTVDDVCWEGEGPGYSSVEHLAGLLRFFKEIDVRATFFAVPRADGIPLVDKPGYVQLLKQALEEGHAVGQHGLVHDRFETGIPPQMILDLSHEGPARERLARDRKAIEASHSVANLRGVVATGRRILEEPLGIKIQGFRAGAGSVCDNLFRALEAEGFRYDSSRWVQEAGWDIINDKTPIVPRPITRERFDSLQGPGKLRCFPLTTDYTWYLPRKKWDITMELARHDFDDCQRVGIPFVPVCHVSPVFQCEDDLGLEFYRRLMDYAREQVKIKGEQLQTLNLDQVSQLSI
jgi:peptidoglycan/xylan/chitin deacetylase (PgdA/CDA1 family)